MPPPIARIRAALGVSQRELAHLLNVSHSQLAKIETGERNTPAYLEAVLSQWVLALDVTEAGPDNPAPQPLEPSHLSELERSAAAYEAAAAKHELKVVAQRAKVAAMEEKRRRWARLEALLPQFPYIDPEGFALLRDRKMGRQNLWPPDRLAQEEVHLTQLQNMAKTMRAYADAKAKK